MSNSNTFLIKATTQGFKKAQGEVKNLTGSMKKFAAGLISVTAAYKGVGAMVDSVKLAGKLEGVESAFNNLRKEAGFSINTFNKLDKALNGTADRMVVMEQANNAMLLGIADSEDQMAEMFDIAQRLAKAVGQDAAFGIESLVTGLGRQSKLMLDNLGIMVDTDAAYKTYAEELGKTADELSDVEKKQAFVNEAMRQGKELVDGIGEESLTTADKLAQLNTSVTNFKIAVGDALIESGAIDMFNNFTAALSNYADKMRTARIETESMSEAEKELQTIIQLEQQQLGELNEKMEFFNTLKNTQLNNTDSEIVKHNKRNEILRASLEVDKMMQDTGLSRVELQERLQHQIDQFTLSLANYQGQLADETEKRQEANQTTKESIGINKENNKLEKNKLELITDQIQEQARKITFEKDGAKISNSLGKAAIKMGKMNAMERWQTTLSMALVNAAAAILKASKEGGLMGGIMMTAKVAPQVSAVYANKPAQTGFEGVVDEPTQFTVGEGGAAEYVSVTPLEGVNNAGGQGVNINISGNVMSDQFVEEELAERIQEAVRKGVDFGMS
mgnify:CR=1 FL=1|tara:strand:+ start:569 stop:2248 length:1680 start_codon:yes stop_codon:yes gene_type:complete